MDPLMPPQPTGNPLLDNPTLKAQLAAKMAQPAQPTGAIMPPGGAAPPPTVTMPQNDRLSLPAPTAPALGPAPRGTAAGDEAELSRKLKTGSGISQIAGKIEGSKFGQAHPTLGKIAGIGAQGLAQLGDIGLRTVAPTIDIATPGTSLHHLADIRGEQRQVGQDVVNEEKQALAGETKARTAAIPETAQRQQDQLTAGLAEHGLQMGPDGQIIPVSEEQLSPEIRAKLQGQWKPVPGVAGPNGEPMEYNETNGTYRISPGSEGASVVSTDKQGPLGSDFNQFYKDWMAANKQPDTPQNRIKARESWAAASQPPQRPPQVLVVNPQGQAEVVRPGSTVQPGSMTPTQLGQINTPTTQERTAAGRAQIVTKEIPTIEAQIQKDAASLGPVMGRWNEFMQGKVGMDNREFANLRANLMLMSSAVALAHAVGRLPENLREQFDQMIDAPKQTPQNLLGVLDAIKPWMQDMANLGKAGANTGGGGNTQTIVQHSASTNQYRYSTDGGKTWQAGQPKQ